MSDATTEFTSDHKAEHEEAKEVDNVDGSVEETEEEEDEEEEEEEEEEEPRLKYSRATTLPPVLYTKDSISSLLICDNFFAFATHGGYVHITDTDLKAIRTLRAHTASVLALSTDGSFLASASLDGTVVIGSVTDEKDIIKASFGRPVHAVALDPNYKSNRSFISGGTDCKVVYSERGWLGRRTDTTITEYDGSSILSVFWIGMLLIWVNEDGIAFYDKPQASIVCQIPKPKHIQRGLKPRVCSPDTNRIYIAWGDTLWSLRVTVERSKMSKIMSSASSVMSLPTETKVETESTKRLDFNVGGIAQFHDNVLILGCLTDDDDDDDGEMLPPELKVYDVENGEEMYHDPLALKNYEMSGPNDYHLGLHVSSGRYFVASAKDVVIAKERDLNDRISWLMDHGQYQQAWEISENMLNVMQRKEAGVKWVDQLVDQGQWSEAIAALSRVLQHVDPDTFKEEWEQYGAKFLGAGYMDELAAALPVYETGVEGLYDKLLAYFLNNDRVQLSQYVKQWPTDLYDLKALRTRIEDELNDHNDDSLRRALVELDLHADSPLDAVYNLLELRDETAVGLVREYHLLPSLIPQLPKLMTVGLLQKDELEHAPVDVIRSKIDANVQLVADGRHQVLPETVIEELNKNMPEMRVVMFLYLEQLSQIDAFLCKDFGDLQIKLYAEFDRPKLLQFLKKNNNYNIGMAVDVCETRRYIPELVYLLGKVGQNKRALELITQELEDPQQAFDFANQQHDRDLWDDLVKYSMDKPEFIKMLLENAASSDSMVDPITIIRKMSDSVNVPGLKACLASIFTEKELLMSINQGVLDIIKGESQSYSNELRALRTRGDSFDFESAAETDGLDLSQAIIKTPDGEVKTESELVGAQLAWKQPADQTPGWSIQNKIRHLGYILRCLRS